jgi:predicted metal-binding membrane protein
MVRIGRSVKHDGMMSYDLVTIILFAGMWTVGMAAMMFPAISPMVLLYSRLIKNDRVSVIETSYPIKMILFAGSYLAVWALAGVVLLLTWSIPMSILAVEAEIRQVQIIYGTVMIIAGAYQFSTLKTKCLGYCESPMSFFARRWNNGTVGAIKMGSYHGLYCLGCCWPYFLLMVALGWMNLLWMILFASVIFGEKIWNRGIWVSRTVGAGFIILGCITVFGPNAYDYLGIFSSY